MLMAIMVVFKMSKILGLFPLLMVEQILFDLGILNLILGFVLV